MWPAWLASGVGGALGGLGTAAANTAGAAIGGKRQYKYSKKLSAFEHAQNMELMKYQLDYNSPASQMGRFKDAGLNPNLVYGQGSPGNLDSPPRYPHMEAPDMTLGMATIGTTFQQGRLASAQADLVNQKTNESGIKQDMMRAQTNLIKANPYMRKEYVDAMVTNMESIAKLKDQEAGFMLSKTIDQDQMERGGRWERGYLKMQRELDLLGQKFNLGSSDLALKAKVMQSKEFDNALRKIQVSWMKDGDINAEHIRQFIMMLLQKGM